MDSDERTGELRVAHVAKLVTGAVGVFSAVAAAQTINAMGVAADPSIYFVLIAAVNGGFWWHFHRI